MKSIVFAFISLFSVLASADASSGLACTMEYASSSVLEAYSVKETSWLSKGQEMSGVARVNDGDGFPGTAPANSIQVSQSKVAGETLWNITVLNSEKTVVGRFSFPEKGGAKFSLPSNAVDDETEDPARFDTLIVTCKFTYFVG